MNSKNNERAFKMSFASVYPLYIQKVEKKGRTVEELNQVITWLTGYDEAGLQTTINEQKTFREFFDEAPKMHPNASKITGLICGYRVEDIEDPLIQKLRQLDKLVDELAKGKKMEKILRE